MTGVLNHLWQSTLFLAGVAVAAWAMRHNPPRARYWLWLAASVKFLVPFSWLVSTGSRVALPAAAPVLAGLPVGTAATYLAPVALPAGQLPAPGGFNWTLWLGGALVLLVRRTRQWWHLHQLRQGAKRCAVDFPVSVLESEVEIEPGVFGLIRPVLLTT